MVSQMLASVEENLILSESVEVLVSRFPRKIAVHFGWAVPAEEVHRMLDSSRSYSKDGSQVFQGDSQEKQESASAAANRWIQPVLSRLQRAG